MARVAAVLAALAVVASTFGAAQPALRHLSGEEGIGPVASGVPTVLDQNAAGHEEAVPTDAPAGVLRHILHDVETELRKSGQQRIVALAAAILGACLVCDGKLSFKWAIVACGFAICGIVGQSDLMQEWPSVQGTLLGLFTGIELGVLGAVVVWAGIDGFATLVGMAVGGLIAYEAQRELVAHGYAQFASGDGCAVVALYTVIVGYFILMFGCQMHVRFVILIGAAVGALLLTSAFSWWLTESVIAAGRTSYIATTFPDAKPQGGDWVDFFNLLWDPDAADVGIFAGSRYNLAYRGQTYRMDRAIGGWVALLIFFISASVQFRSLREANAREVHATEPGGLQRALLSEE
mmetsp:Transcript_12889/g.37135  ORF Transcript_12889/g.37135 Transcript_12889/m.37135 type:complete len:349 (+) Transcript_12889:85-1131(+)